MREDCDEVREDCDEVREDCDEVREDCDEVRETNSGSTKKIRSSYYDDRICSFVYWF
ncbi:major surface glycoprotein [Salsuginibacillus halophilus]|uniref:Major surface glycoprotein n=1 Tax=Salsuginibacillus halophilus TaxID=517424 RepID=A0A2P8HL46_9BACI|nr:hypothetical protein [Salsuginibacillus halophilus]PSL46939.1 major surface glycoprotein [Salsuginibacillus halophilus]